MTDKELRKLNRSELLEILINLSQENDNLRSQIQTMENELSERQLKIDRAGSIAEAALQVNHVFEDAQKAAEQYLENICFLSGRQEQICKQLEAESVRKAHLLIAEAEKKCQTMETETVQKCARMTQEAEASADQTLKAVKKKIQQIIDEQAGLRAILNSVAEGTDHP